MKKTLLTLFLCLVAVGWSFAQTTITTNHVNNNGNGSVTFNVHNGNAFDIIITDLSCLLNTSATNNVQLLYRTTAINYAGGTWGGGTIGAGTNGWVSAGSASLSNTNTANGIVNALSGMSLTIPAGATYGMGFSATTMAYSTLGAGVNTFSGGGVDLVTGDNISWGGVVYPDIPVNYPRGLIGGITFIPAVPCTSPPTAGNATASVNPVCPTATTNLTLAAGTGGTGQTYQWQSSSDGVTYTNIAGATGSSYLATQTTATYYQAIVTCGGMPSTSAPVQVTMSPFMNCYCNSIPTYAGDEEIYSVTVNGGTTNALYAGSNGCSTVAPGPGSLLDRYSNFKTLPAISTVSIGSTVNFSFTQDECNGPTYYSNGAAIWVDFNQNGSFSDPGERVYIENTTSTGPRTVNGTFTIPPGTLPGNTVMRIIAAENYSGASLTPCMTYDYGETEDHLINIACATFAGPTAPDAGVCSGSTVTLTATPSTPYTTISWYDAPTGGTLLATTNSYTTPPVVTTTSFYAQEDFTGCPSSPRNEVIAIVAPVNVVLTPVNASCNGQANGSFTLGTVSCGTAPFSYSLDGGTTYSATIPTNLAAGTYSVIVRDFAMGTSIPYQIIITEPTAPTALNATTSFYTASLSWTAQGNESSWIVEWGPTGFVPGSPQGTIINPATNPQSITGLTPSTAYQFYVSAGCAAGSDVTGPFTFTTDTPFTVFDTECGPGFTDISGTGTLLDFSADPEFFVDEAEVGVTLPFTWNFQGIAVTTMTVGYNGGIVLNSLTGEVTGVIVPSPGLSLYVADLDISDVYTETIGTAPNRQFIVQWTNAPMYLGTNGATFELVIQENSADYFFLYNDVEMDDEFESFGADAEIGIRGPLSNLDVSMNDTEYLTNNSCVRFTTQLCPNPTNLTIDANEEDADLDWNAGAYGEVDWTLIYGPAGFDPANYAATGGTLITTTISEAYLGLLEQNTEYDVYIYSECALDDLTSSGLMANFTTTPYCATPTGLTAQTDVDSLEAAWNWTVNPNFTAFTAEGFKIQYGMTGFDLGTGAMYSGTGSNNADTVFNASFISGGVYQYYVQAVCGATDSVSGWAGPITFTMPLGNDNVCSAETILVDGPVYTFNNNGATVATGEGVIAPPATGAQTTDGWINQTLNGTVWFKFVAPASGNMRVNSTGINYNGQVAVYSVNTCSNFATFILQGANDNAVGSTSLAPNFTICGLTAGSEYYLLFDGFNNTSGIYNLALTSINLEAGLANTTPLTLNVCSGTNVELFNTITGEQAGGVWSSSIPSVNISITGSDLETAGLAYTTYDLQYRVTDGCAYDSILGKVKIFAPSNAGTDGTITACRNESVSLLLGLSGNADLGGTWYTPGGSATTNGAQITTANTQGNYNYTYISGNGVCPNDTALVVVNVLGTCNALSVEEQLFAGVEVFPNPSAGIVFVTSDINFNYEVTDANGRVVTTSQNGVKAAQKTEINLSNVERGVYFIRLNNEDAQKTYRIVIN